MHTFKKEKDGTYAVGQWLVGMLEYRFMPIFYVADRQNAIAAINALNGADLTAAPLYPDFHVIAEHEPKKKSSKGAWIWTAVLLGALLGAVATCSRAHATYYWPGQPPPLIYATEPTPVTLPKQLHGNWCRGEGSYVRNVGFCPPTDRITITARQMIFHETECTVRSAVPVQRIHHRMPLQVHSTLYCRDQTGHASYWLGLWRGGNNLRITETNDTFEPKDYQRFLREHPDD